MTRVYAALLRAFLVFLTSACLVHADEMTFYDLRSAEFAVPADWEITYSSRDQEYNFASPDGRFELWARWWLQDEPQQGFEDVVRQEKRMTAGQEALFLHLDSGGQRTLQLAFFTKDSEGEIFLLQLHSNTTSLADHEAMLDRILSGLKLERQPAIMAAWPSADAPRGGGWGANLIDSGVYLGFVQVYDDKANR